MCDVEVTLKEQNKKYYITIANNVRKLLNYYNMSQNTFCLELEKHGTHITQNSFSKYFPKEKKNQITIPISLIVRCSEIFNVPFEKLVDKDYNPYQEHFITSKQETIRKNIDKEEQDFADYLAIAITRASDKYIVDGNDEAFNGYYQTYHGYLYPTISSEKEPLIAEIEFKKENDICKVDVKLNTGKLEVNGNHIYKFYSGIMVIVEKTKSCYCILTRKNIRSTNELCFLNFRYIPISDINRTLDCRMVEVLTTSAGGDSSFPTIHRMFMSKANISREHLDYILPHLYLNNSTITIEEDKLFHVSTLSPLYKNIIKKIIHLTPNLNTEDCLFFKEEEKISITQTTAVEGIPIRRIMYVLKEDLLRNTAGLYLSKTEVQIFISKLRKYSYKSRYNKVGKKLDDNIRKMLLGLGYYAYGVKCTTTNTTSES